MMDMINGGPEYDAWYAFTVQEEVGTRGAKAAAFTIEPDIAVVLETTTACDIAETSGAKRVCELGRGCVVTYMDRATIYDRELYQLARSTADKLGIANQTENAYRRRKRQRRDTCQPRRSPHLRAFGSVQVPSLACVRY